MSLAEAELVERAKGGDSQAYEQLVLKYQDRVFNACWRICGHLEDARDLTQDAFLKAFEAIAEFRHESGFYTWMFRVAVNLALSHRRKKKRRGTISLDSGFDGDGTQAQTLAHRVGSSAEDDPSEAASTSERHQGLLRALETLDDDQRAVVVLRDIEGFDYGQIGEILDIPPGTVKSRLFRARMALRRAIQPAGSADR